MNRFYMLCLWLSYRFSNYYWASLNRRRRFGLNKFNTITDLIVKMRGWVYYEWWAPKTLWWFFFLHLCICHFRFEPVWSCGSFVHFSWAPPFIRLLKQISFIIKKTKWLDISFCIVIYYNYFCEVRLRQVI